MLSVQHNMLAINADRNLNTNTKKNAKLAEQLSSGYRINRAADDAAGLAILKMESDMSRLQREL